MKSTCNFDYCSYVQSQNRRGRLVDRLIKIELTDSLFTAMRIYDVLFLEWVLLTTCIDAIHRSQDAKTKLYITHFSRTEVLFTSNGKSYGKGIRVVWCRNEIVTQRLPHILVNRSMPMVEYRVFVTCYVIWETCNQQTMEHWYLIP